ncbi:P-loop containing nucleoside triphosphate hydrolases superfamily protein [Artemisia annua]|uniref:P-loop containing nucleoside triphosphate hydrolases superfamily protein n=1 Tax=Artemisia annua TaxID=35608 RepID=A0A2U1PRI0_ARTAN|nr:P-loop containing nucleoside triphosphate hydrolases superfamily protein [Artemisia annua]
MGKNATFISGTEAEKISKEIQKIILDVPTVGRRLTVVDMVGSENIEQAGQTAFEAKMQLNFLIISTNYERRGNGDSHVPLRYNKLAMLLQARLEKIQSELTCSRDGKENEKRNINVTSFLEGSSFAKNLMDINEKSMDLDVGGKHKPTKFHTMRRMKVQKEVNIDIGSLAASDETGYWPGNTLHVYVRPSKKLNFSHIPLEN